MQLGNQPHSGSSCGFSGLPGVLLQPASNTVASWAKPMRTLTGASMEIVFWMPIDIIAFRVLCARQPLPAGVLPADLPWQ
jgi:hypothetical protein